VADVFAHLLVATTGTAHASKVMDLAVRIAQHCGARVSLLYVVVPAELTVESGAPADTDLTAVDRALEAHGRRVLAGNRQAFAAVGLTVASEQIRRGHPAEEIASEAIEIGADLIVVGARGVGGTMGGLLGTISDKVIQLAHCPVLVVR